VAGYWHAEPLLAAPPGVGGLTSSAAHASCGPALKQVRARRDPGRFASEWDRGRSLTLEEALALALGRAA
jgi:hypothetical protein